ncbi:hypothetical protein [Halomicrobium sp. LC1Hm]|uniref:hypothetical protein n=1 Tax=Halomicrobium sp. LC1Hm TaxID=2610902 RepID=UPI0012983EB7|nr:hypothetical protein [Halomicrobium sp. LC1Hm]QGA83763.1 Uncharacterized protein LC1Hm_2731 [Halomicrobium sp. LC1Hm]
MLRRAYRWIRTVDQSTSEGTAGRLEAEDTDAALIRESLRATSERLVVEAGGS